ncbi:sterol desaturase family protein [Spirosoma gilvum]
MKARPLYQSLVLFGICAVVCLWLGFRWLSAVVVAGWFITGLLIFTLIEYGLHRYVFHLKTSTSFRTKIQFAVHGNHHAHPRQLTQVMMKPILALLIITVLVPLFYGLLGVRMLAFLPGFLLGYSLYLALHFVIHAYRPPKNFLRQLWVNHHVHHRTDTVNFGVSSPLWDFIFRTNHST